MDILKSDKSRDSFFKNLSASSQRILISDFDGTLAPFHAERDKVIPYKGVPERLIRIMESGQTRLIIVSGRAISDIIELLNIDPLPEIWGSHGGERFLSGEDIYTMDIPLNIQSIFTEIEAWAQDENLSDCLEKKPLGLAFHWRGITPDRRNTIELKIRRIQKQYIDEAGIDFHDFDGGIEIRLSGINKGQVVKSILATVSVDSAIAYLGDDLTDEDAFVALGDRGLSVLVRSSHRDTCADIRISPPDELIDFFDRWLRAEE